MSKIHILDTVTANKIAAGEVVERPVSVVKELVENAIDAGADEVEIEIAAGGESYLRVSDNGSGMLPEDASLAFLRHATSKIKAVEDIFAISSLGFRGEALPSISAVAKVKIVTRTAETETGFQLVLAGGHEIESLEVGAAVGTTVEVQDLFYNTPARKKFLKTERTESSRINSFVGKIALAHPQIAFRLINNGRTVIETPGNADLTDTFAAIYGNELVEDMLPIQEEYEGISIFGLVGKPSVLKSSRQWQTFVVNQRIIESPLLARALDNAYHSLLPKKGYPVAVLIIQINPAAVDVNVHPQKREIKFSDEQSIFKQVYHAVLSGLTADHRPEEIATEVRHTPAAVGKETDKKITEARLTEGGAPDFTQTGTERSVAPVDVPAARKATGSSIPKKTEHGSAPISRVAEHTGFAEYAKAVEDKTETGEEILFVLDDEKELPVVPLTQLAKCFLICQRGDDLYIIDQHAAHERVLYDRLAASTEGIPAQQLLVPILIQADEHELDLAAEHQADLQALGFELEQAGPNVLRLLAAPADVDATEHERMLREIFSALQAEHAPTKAQLRHRILAYAACRGAIKAGHVLNIRQMRELIKDLFTTERPFVCPHGRPAIVRFDPQDLANLFKRT